MVPFPGEGRGQRLRGKGQGTKDKHVRSLGVLDVTKCTPCSFAIADGVLEAVA